MVARHRILGMPTTVDLQRVAASGTLLKQMQTIRATQDAMNAPLLAATRRAAEVQAEIARAIQPALQAAAAWQSQVAGIHAAIEQSVNAPMMAMIRDVAATMDCISQSIPLGILEAAREAAEASPEGAVVVQGVGDGIGAAMWRAYQYMDLAWNLAEGIELDVFVLKLTLVLFIWPMFNRRNAAAA